jgi:SAM-dependent methyltransferase
MPRAAKRSVHRLLRLNRPAVGNVDFGDLARTRPISSCFGFDRGIPVDRHYIERFLEVNASDISGRVLEVGERTYSDRFGTGVTSQDVLHVHANPQATIVGDLAAKGTLQEASFDCIILTQTLHLIYDMAAAVEALHRALRPGGVALVTVPGISAVDRGEWGSGWCWSLTSRSARELFEPIFGEGNVQVEVHGNVYAATCFLHGLAVEDIEGDWLDLDDSAFPVTVVIRARRAG